MAPIVSDAFYSVFLEIDLFQIWQYFSLIYILVLSSYKINLKKVFIFIFLSCGDYWFLHTDASVMFIKFVLEY